MINRLPKQFAAARDAALQNLEDRRPAKSGILGGAAESVGAHPIAILAAAFVTGLLIGNWTKR